MELQWVPSHVGVPGNEVADSLAKNAYFHDNPTIRLKRFAEARLLIRGVIRLRHPDASVSSGNAPPPVPTKRILRSDAALLHRLHSNSSLTRARLHQLNRLTSSHCPACGVEEDLEHIFLQCTDQAVHRTAMISELRKANRPHLSIRDFLSPTGTRSACRERFEIVLTFLHLTGLSDCL